MPLSKKAIDVIRPDNRLRSLLALEADVTEYTIVRWINSNHVNLTRANLLKIIREETGLENHEILVEDTIAGVQ